MARKKRTYKEELTTKMHAEFKVSRIVEEQNRCMSVLTLLNGDLTDETKVNEYIELYDVDRDDLEACLPEYQRLVKTQ